MKGGDQVEDVSGGDLASKAKLIPKDEGKVLSSTVNLPRFTILGVRTAPSF